MASPDSAPDLSEDATLTETIYEHSSSIVNLRINEILQTGAVRNRIPIHRDTVYNCADAVRLKTAPTGLDGMRGG